MMFDSNRLERNGKQQFPTSILGRCLLMILSICLILAACQKEPDGLLKITEGTRTPSSIHTEMLSVDTDFTSSPTKTLTPTFEPTSTGTPRPSLTPSLTPRATLDPEEARETLFKWLSTNRDCELPCILGIKPGETTAIEAQGPFQYVSSVSDFFTITPELVYFSYLLPQDNITMTIQVGYLIAESTISEVAFSGRAHADNGDPDVRGIIEIFDSPFLGNTLRKYMIPAVLTDLGIPSAVQIQTLSRHWGEGFVPPQPPVKFRVILLYPGKGIYALDTTEMKVEGESVVGCFANAHVTLNLFSPDVEQEAYWDWVESRPEYKNGLPLEQATSLTIEKFSNSFSQREMECIVSPADIWPEPEF